MRMDDDDDDTTTTATTTTIITTTTAVDSGAITTAGGTPARKKAKRKSPPPPELPPELSPELPPELSPELPPEVTAASSPEVAGGAVPGAVAASTASTAKKRTPAAAPLSQVDGLDDSCKTKRDRPRRSKPEPRIARSKASLLREAGKLPPPPSSPSPSPPPPSPVLASATAAGQDQPAPQQRPGLADQQSDGWPHTAKHEFFLTPTEIAVMEGVVVGMKDSEIRTVVGQAGVKPDPDRPRSRATVRSHLEAIFIKLNTRKRAPAIARILLKHIDLQQHTIAQLKAEVDRLTQENQQLREEQIKKKRLA